MNSYYTGDTIPVVATLSSDGNPVDLTGATIKACIVGADKKTAIVPAVAIGIDGNPTLGKVVGAFPSSTTKVEKIPTACYVEIETLINGVVTTYGQTQITLLPSNAMLG